MPVDVERLRVERHVGEQHVVHLRHGAAVAVLEHLAGDEVVEIDAAALVTLGRRGLGHDPISFHRDNWPRALTRTAYHVELSACAGVRAHGCGRLGCYPSW